jgi:hypothetical protein
MTLRPPDAARVFAAAAVLPLLGACADAPTSAPSGRPPTVAQASRAAPGGAQVVEFPFLIFGSFFGGDPSSGLAVVVGPSDPIAGIAAACAGLPVELGPGSGRAVFTPSGAFIARTSGTAVPVAVLEYGEGIVTDPCVLTDAAVVATGTVTFRQAVVSGRGAQVTRVSVEGVVTLATGGQAFLSGSWRQVTRPDGTIVFDREPVTLTPL